MIVLHVSFVLFNTTPTTLIYTLSLHDALPILGWSSSPLGASLQVSHQAGQRQGDDKVHDRRGDQRCGVRGGDRKSTRLNSSHVAISYAVFCLKKKKRTQDIKHER